MSAQESNMRMGGLSPQPLGLDHAAHVAPEQHPPHLTPRPTQIAVSLDFITSFLIINYHF